jgi:O-antigen/teichoic acid export membrane protein
LTALPADTDTQDIDALARGGRTNILGFLIRLAARVPFLIIGGRIYGAAILGRMAYACLIIELTAQIATMGLRRGLALQLSKTDANANHEVWDGLLLSLIVAAPMIVLLALFPRIMFPNSEINRLDQLIPLVAIALSLSEIMLAALAFKFDIGATVRARAIVEPWVIAISAWIFSYGFLRDGLLMAYATSLVAGLITATIPFVKSFGMPRGWTPHPIRMARLARRNLPLAAADAIEWATRRIDLAILGLFVAPATVGIYFIAQHVATVPQRLKISFDPILGPVVTRNLEAGKLNAVANQISQVGFWIMSVQAGIAVALGMAAAGVLGLVGPQFVGAQMALIFLLLAEVMASAGAVSESALVYIARHRNLLISSFVLAVQAGLTALLVLAVRREGWGAEHLAAAPALAMVIALTCGSLLKMRLASKLLATQLTVWRWPVLVAVIAAGGVGWGFNQTPEWSALLFGIPAMLGAYALAMWKFGFAAEDRALFRRA